MFINVVDSIMGSGKTTAAIKMMRNSPERRWMYVTPYLAEVERVKKECGFREPQKSQGAKLQHVKELLAKKENIVTTHSLFKLYDDECRELIASGGYRLVVDEVIEPMEVYRFNKSDRTLITESRFVDVDDESGILSLTDDGYEYNGMHNDMFRVIERYETSLVDDTAIIVNCLPKRTLESFVEVYLLTYMYDSSILCYYLRSLGFREIYMFIDNDMTLTATPNNRSNEIKKNIVNKIHILDHKKANSIGRNIHALSHSWFSNGQHKESIDKLRRHVRNVVRNVWEASSKDVMWTTYKSAEKKIGADGFRQGFVPCNARATNEYGDRHYLVYALNRYPSVSTVIYLNQVLGEKVSTNKYALSELLQWIFRSAIRNGEDIYIYLPSSRMRKLLQEWIDDEDDVVDYETVIDNTIHPKEDANILPIKAMRELSA